MFVEQEISSNQSRVIPMFVTTVEDVLKADGVSDANVLEDLKVQDVNRLQGLSGVKAGPGIHHWNCVKNHISPLNS